VGVEAQQFALARRAPGQLEVSTALLEVPAHAFGILGVLSPGSFEEAVGAALGVGV
jgi:hypothetical protein